LLLYPKGRAVQAGIRMTTMRHACRLGASFHTVRAAGKCAARGAISLSLRTQKRVPGAGVSGRCAAFGSTLSARLHASVATRVSHRCLPPHSPRRRQRRSARRIWRPRPFPLRGKQPVYLATMRHACRIDTLWPPTDRCRQRRRARRNLPLPLHPQAGTRGSGEGASRRFRSDLFGSVSRARPMRHACRMAPYRRLTRRRQRRSALRLCPP
jgi:hypothetical protein